MAQTNKSKYLAQKNEKYNEPLPTRLRELLDNGNTIDHMLEITRQGLAKHLGVSSQQVSNYCTGKTTPDADCLCKIAKFLNVSADYLLGLAKTPNPEINDREIHRQLGLSDKAIAILKNDVDYVRKLNDSTDIDEAYEKGKEKMTCLPAFKLLDVLLCEQGISSTRELLGYIMAFERKGDPDVESEIFDIKVDENGKPKIAGLRVIPRIQDDDIFHILLFKLQNAVIKLKDDFDKQGGN